MYFSLASDLNLLSELINSDILIKSNNLKIHKLYYESLLRMKGITKDQLIKLLQFSQDKFPNDKYFKDILLQIN